MVALIWSFRVQKENLGNCKMSLWLLTVCFLNPKQITQDRCVSSTGLNWKFKLTCDLVEEDSGMDYFVMRTVPLYLPAWLESNCSFTQGAATCFSQSPERRLHAYPNYFKFLCLYSHWSIILFRAVEEIQLAYFYPLMFLIF